MTKTTNPFSSSFSPNFNIILSTPGEGSYTCLELEAVQVDGLEAVIERAESIRRDLAGVGETVTVECGGITLWAGAGA